MVTVTCLLSIFVHARHWARPATQGGTRCVRSPSHAEMRARTQQRGLCDPLTHSGTSRCCSSAANQALGAEGTDTDGPAQRLEVRSPATCILHPVKVTGTTAVPEGLGSSGREGGRQAPGWKVLGSYHIYQKLGSGGKKARMGARPGAPQWVHHSVTLRLPPAWGQGPAAWLLLPACLPLPCPAGGQEMSPGQRAGVLLSQPRFR